MASKQASYGYRKYAFNRRLGRIEGQVRKATAATEEGEEQLNEQLNEPVDVLECFVGLRR
jgi:hypothetical protein